MVTLSVDQNFENELSVFIFITCIGFVYDIHCENRVKYFKAKLKEILDYVFPSYVI